MKSKPDLANLNFAEPPSVMDATIQGYLQAISIFQDNGPNQLPDELEQFLLHVAKTGDVLSSMGSSWEKIQKIFVMKMKHVIDEFYETNPYVAGKVNSNCENDEFSEMRERLVTLVHGFDSPPFTFQRLCELLTNPKKNYTKCEKFMRAVEKNLMVVSSWNYPSRRSSEGVEQVNGGFDVRSNYGSHERSLSGEWASLPHSPIPLSSPAAPYFPAATKSIQVLFKEENTKSNDEDADTSDNATENSDEKPYTENGTVSSVAANQDENQSSSNKKSLADYNCELKDDNKADDGSQSEGANYADFVSSNTGETVTTTLGTFTSIATNESGDSILTLTDIKHSSDEKKEPLPGVDTLIKCSSTETISTEKIENPKNLNIDYQAGDFGAEESTGITASSRSPKRKLSSEEIPMEIGSPTKRAKYSDDEDTNMESAEHS